MVPLLLMLAAGQVDASMHCSPAGSFSTCQGDDGSTLTERRSSAQLIREGNDGHGYTWTEVVFNELDGTRLRGKDSRGRTWEQYCTPGFGTRGTDRFNNPIFIPPVKLPPQPGSDKLPYAPCPGREP